MKVKHIRGVSSKGEDLNANEKRLPHPCDREGEADF